MRNTLTLTFLLAMSTLSAADLTGRWTGTFTEGQNEGKSALLVLKQTGIELTGTAGPNEDGQRPIQNGKVDGDKVSFDLPADGSVIHFELTASEKRLTGTARGEHEGQTRTATLDVTKSE